MEWEYLASNDFGGIIPTMTAIRMSLRTVTLRAISVTAGLAGLFGLYYGAFNLFLLPGYPGESFFTVSRMTFGLLPLVLAVSFLVLAAWMWTFSSNLTLSILVKRAIFGSAAAFALFWVVLIIIARVTHRIP